MQLYEAKVGDEVLLYIRQINNHIDDARIAEVEQRTAFTIKCYVILAATHYGNSAIVGFKSGDKRLASSAATNKYPGYTHTNTFFWDRVCLPANTTFTVNNNKIVLNKSSNVSDWKAWQHNRPGECVCGINIKDCSYHNDQKTI